MSICYYGTTGTISNPWDEACRQFDAGEISRDDLLAIAHDLFEGVELQDAIVDVVDADLRKQSFLDR
jgi:hypothetical protein